MKQKKDFILHDLRLCDQNGCFQIDKLLLNENYLLILEIKNWYGTIVFVENGQVTRIGDHGIEEGFPNPIPQAKLQQYRLRKWLHQYGRSHIPIHFLVVISFPSTIIKSLLPDNQIPKNIVHNNQLFFTIQTLEEKYTESLIHRESLFDLPNKLVEAHVPVTPKLLDKYGINKQGNF